MDLSLVKTILQVLLAVTGLLLVLLVLLHRGRGGGLSDMFGGGMTQSLNTSGAAQKNVVRITTVLATIWVLAIVGYALVLRFNPVA